MHRELRELHAAGLPTEACSAIARHVGRAVEIAGHEGGDDGAGAFGWGAASAASAWRVAERELAQARRMLRDQHDDATG